VAELEVMRTQVYELQAKNAQLEDKVHARPLPSPPPNSEPRRMHPELISGLPPPLRAVCRTAPAAAADARGGKVRDEVSEEMMRQMEAMEQARLSAPCSLAPLSSPRRSLSFNSCLPLRPLLHPPSLSLPAPAAHTARH